MKKTLFVALVATVAILATSCKKAEAPKAVFEYTLDAEDVTLVQFTNLSKNADSYKWEFGDGQTSNETSPKHQYAEGGKYVVTLTAEGKGGTKSCSEEINLAAPKVKIDGKFEDWDKLVSNKEKTLVAMALTDGNDKMPAMKKAWCVTDADYVYFSFEYTPDGEDGYMTVMQFDVSIDQDGDKNTGAACDSWGDSETGEFAGIEYCVQYGDEVGLIAEVPGGNGNCGPESYPYWMDWAKYNIYIYDAEGNCDDGKGGTNWINQDCKSDMSAKVASGDNSRVEFRIPRSVFPKALNVKSQFGIKCYNQGWEDQTGAMPEVKDNEGEDLVQEMAKFIFED